VPIAKGVSGEPGPVVPGLLVDADWLEAHIGDARLRIVDLRDSASYMEGHIPGAVRLDLEDLGHHVDGCDNVLLPPMEFAQVMRRLGISNGDTIVAYDDHWGLPSARLLWALHRYGERSVGMLNGGWDRWSEEGRPVSATGSDAEEQLTEGRGPEAPGRGQVDDFETHLDPDVAADYEWIKGEAGREGVVLLDTRSQAEFDQGHLPGAISWDWFNAVPAGSWECSRESGELRSELATLGVDPSDEVVAYCRSGMRAAHTYVVLRNAGFAQVRLYDGSWQEWDQRG
jgi:thiosulfate/3-mercaptopyruvate sulfurtransferase